MTAPVVFLLMVGAVLLGANVVRAAYNVLREPYAGLFLGLLGIGFLAAAEVVMYG